MAGRLSKTIVLIHGAWVTPASWDGGFKDRLEAAGYQVVTPSWPLIEGLTAAEINRRVPEGFGSLSVGRIVDHLQAVVEAQPEPPVLVGHSFGGLFTQLLLDRGAGLAGVALNPAPIGGIFPGPLTLAAALPVVARVNGWSRPYVMSRDLFAESFANGSPRELSDAAWDSYVIPAPGRIIHQAASWLGTVVHPYRRTAPLLITSGDEDRLVTPYLSHAAYAIQRRSPARTDHHLFPGRSHLLCAEPGWEQVADFVLDWLDEL